MIKKILLLAGILCVLMCFTGICVYADNADKTLNSVKETLKESKSKDKTDQKKQTNTIVRINGVWTYIGKDGKPNYSYNGIASNANGTYLIKRGKAALSENGVVNGGKGNWYYVRNGKVQTSFTGLQSNQYGWWYVKDGKVDFSYTGLKKNEYGWWYVKNGKVDFSCNSVEKNEYGWWYVENGMVRFDYTGIKNNRYGWWRIVNGMVDFSCNSVESNEYGWWYIRDGKVDFSYNGLASNAYGTWAIENGKVNFNLNKYYFDNNTVSLVSNGKLSSVLSQSNATAVLSARSIAAQITNNSMTESQKIWACFDYTITHFRSTANPRIPHYTGWDWMYIYANDMFVNGGGNCISFAAAFSLLAKAAGVNNVYACYSGAHAWTEINGLVYDPEQYHDTNDRKIYAWSYNDGLQNYQAAISNWPSAPWKYIRVPDF